MSALNSTLICSGDHVRLCRDRDFPVCISGTLYNLQPEVHFQIVDGNYYSVFLTKTKHEGEVQYGLVNDQLLIQYRGQCYLSIEQLTRTGNDFKKNLQETKEAVGEIIKNALKRIIE